MTEILQLLHAHRRVVRLAQEGGDTFEVIVALQERKVIGATVIHDLVVEHDGARVFNDRIARNRFDVECRRNDHVAVEFLQNGGKGDVLAGAVPHAKNAFETWDTVTAIDEVETENRRFAGRIEGFFRLQRSLHVDSGTDTGTRILLEDEIADVPNFFSVDLEIRTLPEVMRDERLRRDGDRRWQKDHGRIGTDDRGNVDHGPLRLDRLAVGIRTHGAERAGIVDPGELSVGGDGEKDDVGLMGNAEPLGGRAVFTRETDNEADIVAERKTERTDTVDVVAVYFRPGRDDHRDHTVIDPE